MNPIPLHYGLAIALGGALGAVGRFWISTQMDHLVQGRFPLGTLTVNVTGAFLFGLLAILHSKYEWFSDAMRLLLLTGGMGALTTFSTFSFETLRLMEQGRFLTALSNILASVVISLVAVWFGMRLGDRL